MTTTMEKTALSSAKDVLIFVEMTKARRKGELQETSGMALMLYGQTYGKKCTKGQTLLYLKVNSKEQKFTYQVSRTTGVLETVQAMTTSMSQFNLHGKEWRFGHLFSDFVNI